MLVRPLAVLCPLLLLSCTSLPGMGGEEDDPDPMYTGGGGNPNHASSSGTVLDGGYSSESSAVSQTSSGNASSGGTLSGSTSGGTSRGDGGVDPTCQDECSWGHVQCASNGDGVQTCGHYDTDACLEWSTPQACPQNSSCHSGQCSSDTGCMPGEHRCSDDYGFQTCGFTHGTYQWGERIPCQVGNMCVEGVCQRSSCLEAEVVLLLDRSSSMLSSGAWSWVRTAVESVVDTWDRRNFLGFRQFPLGDACGVGEVVPLAKDNGPAIKAAIVDPTVSSATPIQAALNGLQVFGDRNDGQAAILITDGDESCGTAQEALDAAAALYRSGVPVYVIGVTTTANMTFLDRLALTGGTGMARRTNNQAELDQALSDVMHELHACRCDASDTQCTSAVLTRCLADGTDLVVEECPAIPDSVAVCRNNGCDVQCNSGTRMCNNACAACPVNASSTQCSGNQCVAVSCSPGFHVCNGDCVGNTSVDHCGSSCTPCPTSPDGEAWCDGARCHLECNLGTLECGTSCASCPQDAHADQFSCASGNACVISTCTPSTTYRSCGQSCVRKDDAQHCGANCQACPTDPHGTPTCINEGMTCSLDCNANHKLCSGHCAACPVDPNATAFACISGQCRIDTCTANTHRSCGTSCVLMDDPQHCGATCSACPGDPHGTATCINHGTLCSLDCNNGHKLCDGACAACPVDALAQTFECAGAECRVATCQPGALLCNGKCAPCPANNHVMKFGCDANACVISACEAGYEFINGACVNKGIYVLLDGGLTEKVTCGLVVNQDKVATIAYVDGNGDRLKAMSYTGPAWQTVTVADNIHGPGQMTLDDEGRPVLTYVTGDGSRLAFAEVWGTNYYTTYVTQDVDIYYQSGAVSPTGEYRAVFMGTGLQMGYQKNGQWAEMMLHQGPNIGFNAFATWASPTTFRILYETSYAVYMMDVEGERIVSDTMIGGYGDAGAVVVDAQGNNHIVFFDLYNDGWVHYLKGEPGAWETDERLFATGYIHSMDIAVDSTGRPHIIYTDDPSASFETTYYVTWDGNTWQREELGRSDSYALHSYAHVAVDKDDGVYLAFNIGAYKIGFARR